MTRFFTTLLTGTAFIGTALISTTSAAHAWSATATTQSPPSNGAPMTKTGAETGRFLHLSDIHFDPFYHTGMSPAQAQAANRRILARLLSAPVSRWDAIFAQTQTPVPAHGAGHDSNYALMHSALADAAAQGRYDFVIYTGDYIVHHFVQTLSAIEPDPAVRAAFMAKVVAYVNHDMRRAFPGARLIAALGNNDAACWDYGLVPDGTFLNDSARTFPGAKRDGAQYRHGGWLQRRGATPVHHLEAVSLSLYWSAKWPEHGCAQGAAATPEAQLDWLSGVLAKASAHDRRVMLLMHVPPGIDAWGTRHAKPGTPRPVSFWQTRPDFVAKLTQLIRRYPGTVVSAFAGHTHEDEFRVLRDAKGPVLAIRMGPSISPVNGNLPAYTIVRYDLSSGLPIDYQVHHLANAATLAAGVKPKWRVEYDFDKTYGAKAYDAPTLERLALRLQSDPALASVFMQHYTSGAPSPEQAPAARRYTLCALNNTEPSDYERCLGPMADTGDKSTAPETTDSTH